MLATPARARTPFRWIAALALTAALAGAAASRMPLPDLFSLGNPFAETEVDRSGPAVLHALADVSRYEAATASYSLVVDVEKDAGHLPAFLKGERTSFLAVGTVDASVDFTGLRDDAIAVAPDGKSVTIILPKAMLGQPRVDPAQSRVLDRDRGLVDRVAGAFSDSPTGERELYLLAEQKLAAAAAADSGLVPRAQANTERMLRGLLAPLGFEAVQVQFTG